MIQWRLLMILKTNRKVNVVIFYDMKKFIYSESLFNTLCRSSHQSFSVRKDLLRNLTKFTGKHLCQSLFFNKVAAATLLKKRLWHRCFPVNFEKFQRTPSLQNTSWWLLLSMHWCKSQTLQKFPQDKKKRWIGFSTFDSVLFLVQQFLSKLK